MSARLEILKKSLVKKEVDLDRRIAAHFEDVKSANGQPLNDKRNGQATFNRWEKKNDSIRNAETGIELTKAAIEKEENKIKGVEFAKNIIPQPILDLVASGVLIQWRKHPLYFFVKGVDKCRIIWHEDKKCLGYKRPIDFSDSEQWRLFAKTYNELNKKIINQ